LSIYGIVLICLTASNEFKDFFEDENIISIISKIFIASEMLFLLANMFLFIRIGEVFIKNKQLIIKQNELEKIIELCLIEEITMGKERGNFYYIEILDTTLTIELNKSQCTQLKKT